MAWCFKRILVYPVEFCEADPKGFHWGLRILLKKNISVSSGLK
jgi:hypothetical protein